MTRAFTCQVMRSRQQMLVWEHTKTVQATKVSLRVLTENAALLPHLEMIRINSYIYVCVYNVV